MSDPLIPERMLTPLRDIQAIRLRSEIEAIEKSVSLFASDLRDKLHQKALEGRTGFDDPNWAPEQIRAELYRILNKGDPIDAAAYCMFLWLRGGKT